MELIQLLKDAQSEIQQLRRRNEILAAKVEFLVEILTRGRVIPFNVGGCNQTLYSHAACIKLYGKRNLNPMDLPEDSPLRIAWLASSPSAPPSDSSPSSESAYE